LTFERVPLPEFGNKSSHRDRGYTGAGILFAAIFTDVFLSLSAPGAAPFTRIIAFLALLLSVAILFTRTIDWRPGNLPVRLLAALAVAVYGLHPSTIAALKGNVDENLVASLAGIAAGLAICQWNPAHWWHRWASLLFVLPCILLHLVGVGFAPLLAASLWLGAGERGAKWRSIVACWPALVVSALAGFLHRADGFHPGAAMVAFAAIPGSFFMPLVSSTSSGWGIVDGLACLAATLGIMIAASSVFRFPAVSFGLFWFLVMAALAPTEPLAAFPGLASATVAALAAAAISHPESHSSWLEVDS
jgi:hypothetical protein